MNREPNPFAPPADLKIWMDGEMIPAAEAKVSVFDHGLLYGDGCFEGIRIYNGKIFRDDAHIRRFYESCHALRLDIGMSAQELKDAEQEAIKANSLTGDGYIRMIATRGVGSLGLSIKHTACPSVIIIANKIQLYPEEAYKNGLKCITSSYNRPHANSLSPRVKSLNYLNNVMAKVEAMDAGCDEAVMLNHEGHVAECTGDNLFVIRDGVISTPPTSAGLLDGITRGVAMEVAREAGYTVKECSLVRHDIYVADECFLTGSAAEVIPMVMLDNRPIGNGKPGKITNELIKGFRAKIAQECK